MGFLVDGNKKNCYGCQMCGDICSKGAITFIEDEEGFLYPHIDINKCVKCHLCEKKCPNNYQFNCSNVQQPFVFAHQDSSVLKQSASGGAFTAIANTLFDTFEKVAVFGVAWDEDLNVVMKFTTTLQGLNDFRKSKYVQCNTVNCYKQVASFLSDGYCILFSGTPCQNAALLSFLGDMTNEKRDRIYTVDLICHGVPNQKLFNLYRKEKETEIGRIIGFEFRCKEEKDGLIDSTNGKIRTKENHYIVSVEEDAFLNAYYKRLDYRPSCGECRFAQQNRVTDITIGDAWKIEDIYEELNPNIGASVIIGNSEKGKRLIHKLDNLKPVSIEYVVKSNEAFAKPTVFHKNRSRFFSSIEKGEPFSHASFCATKLPFHTRLIHRFISPSLRKKIKKVLNYDGGI